MEMSDGLSTGCGRIIPTYLSIDFAVDAGTSERSGNSPEIPLCSVFREDAGRLRNAVERLFVVQRWCDLRKPPDSLVHADS